MSIDHNRSNEKENSWPRAFLPLNRAPPHCTTDTETAVHSQAYPALLAVRFLPGPLIGPGRESKDKARKQWRAARTACPELAMRWRHPPRPFSGVSWHQRTVCHLSRHVSRNVYGGLFLPRYSGQLYNLAEPHMKASGSVKRINRARSAVAPTFRSVRPLLYPSSMAWRIRTARFSVVQMQL